MEAGMVGADADGLVVIGKSFLRSSEILRGHRDRLTSIFAGAAWTGPDADHSRADWTAVGSPALVRTSRFVETLGNQLLEHAAEQRGASTGASTRVGSTAPVAFGPWWPDDLFGDVRDFVDDLFDDLFGDGDGDGSRPSPLEPRPPVGDLSGLRPSGFDTPIDGRGAVLMAMQGLAEEDRIARDEIEIRALDNGRYIVVLPGVTDLSEGFDQFVDRVREDGPFGVPGAGRHAIDTWADNDEPTVRKMRYAFEAARRDDTTVNEYSVVTIAALESAGVPPGAELMIVGHSFGAYTAITDWRFDDVPAGTATLVLNNRLDGVYRAEDLLHADGHAEHVGHLEHDFWGGRDGYGHDELNYIDWLAGTGDDEIEDWLDDVGARYAAGGARVSVRVPDPNL